MSGEKFLLKEIEYLNTRILLASARRVSPVTTRFPSPAWGRMMLSYDRSFTILPILCWRSDLTS